MDRKTLKKTFTKDHTPDWICPACTKGVLKIKDGSFLQDERSHSRDHHHDAWEPEWIEYVYSCLLQCTNGNCMETVASSGTGGVDWSVDYENFGEPEQVYSDFFRPLYFQPSLKIISIPDSCPDSVSDPINGSFDVFFVSPSAAANSIRISVEHLLTELKIPRFKNENGKKKYLPLHRRINLLPAKYSEIKDIVMAIKWLGNAGSHSSVGFDEVMDAYEFLEHVLKEIYDPKTKNLKAKAKKVNKKKGP